MQTTADQIVLGSAIPTMVIDTRHVVTHFNTACENLTGISANQIIGTCKQWQPFYAQKRPILADLLIDGASEERIAAFYPGKYRRSSNVPGAYEAEDFFPDLGQRGKWLFFTAAPLHDGQGNPAGAIVTIQDVTTEKIAAKQRETMLRISLALPGHPELEELLDYISREVAAVLETEGALVVLWDERNRQHYFLGSAYQDTGTEERVKRCRFEYDQLAAGRVLASGQPLIINDPDEAAGYTERDRQFGYRTRNLAEVPLRVQDRIIGVLAALNKTGGDFEPGDIELLETLAGTVALSVENARISSELKEAYEQVSMLNRAKDRAINHLSHELKTPLGILGGALDLLEDQLNDVPKEQWNKSMAMLRRNVGRLEQIQNEAADIMQGQLISSRRLTLRLLEECIDELALLVTRDVGNPSLLEQLRQTIQASLEDKRLEPEPIALADFLRVRLDQLQPILARRQLEIIAGEMAEGVVFMAPEHLGTIVDGLIKNAVENTPNEGTIHLEVTKAEAGLRLIVQDFGVGVPETLRQRIFEGLSPIQSPVSYSTKQPYDFNAGGKGLDLLRLTILSERYGFEISLDSMRCPQLTSDQAACPGRISQCPACSDRNDCHASGRTGISLFFPDSLLA
jgi:signal transduction histidine kinase